MRYLSIPVWHELMDIPGCELDCSVASIICNVEAAAIVVFQTSLTPYDIQNKYRHHLGFSFLCVRNAIKIKLCHQIQVCMKRNEYSELSTQLPSLTYCGDSLASTSETFHHSAASKNDCSNFRIFTNRLPVDRLQSFTALLHTCIRT